MIHQTLRLAWTQTWQIAVLFFAILILFQLFARGFADKLRFKSAANESGRQPLDGSVRKFSCLPF